MASTTSLFLLILALTLRRRPLSLLSQGGGIPGRPSRGAEGGPDPRGIREDPCLQRCEGPGQLSMRRHMQDVHIG